MTALDTFLKKITKDIGLPPPHQLRGLVEAVRKEQLEPITVVRQLSYTGTRQWVEATLGKNRVQKEFIADKGIIKEEYLER